jgi:hypothetical protein
MLDLSVYLSAAVISLMPLNMTTREAADWKYLQSVALVESGANYNAVGDRGKAFGAYQMHMSAWVEGNQWLKANGRKTWYHSEWRNPKAQDEVAFGFLQVCKERLNKHQMLTPLHLYLCYTMGFEGLRRLDFDPMRCPEAKRDAAVRVTNLFIK